jgi:hypothetical protein
VIELAVALTVEQIEKIELTCCNSESLRDRALVGGILLMIYGSTRAPDTAHAIKLLVDRDARLWKSAEPMDLKEQTWRGDVSAKKAQ